MTIIKIPGLDRTFSKWDSVADHLLITHHPDGPADQSELEQAPDDMRWSCPSCDVPITRQSVLVHTPCLVDDSSTKSIPSLGPQNGVRGICPICGESTPTSQGLHSHIKSHNKQKVASTLSSPGQCQICGEDRQSPDDLDGHHSCIASRAVERADNGTGTDCPIEHCPDSASNRGSMLWHLWDAHFKMNGFTGNCPGCGNKLSLGELQSHITHLGPLSETETKNIVQSTPGECIICGFSPFGVKQLWTHYKSEHEVVGPNGRCQECGAIPSNDNIQAIKNHLFCIINQAEELPDLPQEWPCPECSTTLQTRSEFFEHISSHPKLLAFSGSDCRFCGESMESVQKHTRCMAHCGSGLERTSGGENGVKLPFQEIRSNRTHRGRDRLSTKEGEEQAQLLNQFIAREKESARQETRETYQESSVHQLKYETELIYDLVSMGEVNHPDHGTQIVFERPVPDYEHDPQDLTSRFGIYPRQEVIVGHEGESSRLPVEAVITFTADQRLGVAPASHEETTESEFKKALTGEGNFHVVSLLHPTPFERERKAVEQAKQRSEWEILRGTTDFTEESRWDASLYSGRLNESQERAVNRALGTEEVMCIHGPPGTGKTQTLTALIELAVAGGQRVLACAHSNQATDNLLIGGSTTNRTDLSSLHATVQRNDNISMVRVGGRSRNQVIKDYYLEGDAEKADIVGVTANAAATLSKDRFDLVVVDEATQASQPSTMVPWLRGDTLILAGDHHQLPPYASDELAKEQEMHISLFEYLSRRYGESIMEQLSTQYRMHRSIAEYSNQMFYDGDLYHGRENKTWTIDKIDPLVGYHISGDERTDSESHSKYNPSEASLVADHIEELCSNGVSARKIGVITPYGAQIGVIASKLQSRGISHPDQIEINTIDSYQGSEKEIIIVSFVRSNSYNSSGFLSFPDEGYRRLNVALTRAKKHIALIGDWNTLGTVADNREANNSCAEIYAKLEAYIKKEGRFEHL